MNTVDTKFEQQLKERLDQSIDSIDDDNQLRLASIRKAAMKRVPSRQYIYLIPAAALLVCVLVYTLLTKPHLQEEQLFLDGNGYMSAVELIDFYEDPDLAEDIDLHLWLNDYPVSG